MSDLARELRRLHDEVRAWTPPDMGKIPLADGPGQDDGEGRDWRRSESSARRDEALWETIEGRFRVMEEKILALERREAMMTEELERRVVARLKSVNDHHDHLQDTLYDDFALGTLPNVCDDSAVEQRRLYDDMLVRQEATPIQPHPQLAQSLRHQSDRIDIIQDEVRYLKRSLTDALELFNHRWASSHH